MGFPGVCFVMISDTAVPCTYRLRETIISFARGRVYLILRVFLYHIWLRKSGAELPGHVMDKLLPRVRQFYLLDIIQDFTGEESACV